MGLVLEVTDGVRLLHLAVLDRSRLPLSRGGLRLARGSAAEVRAYRNAPPEGVSGSGSRNAR